MSLCMLLVLILYFVAVDGPLEMLLLFLWEMGLRDISEVVSVVKSRYVVSTQNSGVNAESRLTAVYRLEY